MNTSSNVTIRYDGFILAEHRMDISDLAPALIAISELCKIANSKFNDNKSSVKVLMKADIAQKCIQLDLQVVLTLWDNIKSLINDEDTKSAKEILDWIGIIVGSASIYGAIKLSSSLRDKTIDSVEYTVKDGKNVAQINVKGDNNTVNNIVYAYPQAVELLKDDSAVSNIKKIVSPLVKEGYEILQFETDDHVESITKTEAAAIMDFEPSFTTSQIDDAQIINAWVTAYSPVYDKDKTKWRFRLGDAIVNMDISETDIAERAINRGGALMHDAYYVRLELRQEHKSNNKITTEYKIKEVLEFRPGRIEFQRDIFDDKL
ncbi:MAG: hypothetical protein H0X02_02120 [Nitrosomonas sp.]|nr:hypothetical protein [Nitrosomonas sp.]